MMNYLKKLWSEENGKKWWEKKTVILTAGIASFAVIGIINPTAIGDLPWKELSQDGMTWGGLALLLVQARKNFFTKG